MPPQSNICQDRQVTYVPSAIDHSLIDLYPAVILQENKNATFPNFNFNTSHQGDYVGIASEPLSLVGLDIVSISKPQGESTIEFINNFSSYLTDHEWNCVVRAGSSSEILTEFYRYNILDFLSGQ